MIHASKTLFAASLVLGCLVGSTQAQCSRWSTGFELTGPDYNVYCLASFDDGSGPMLYMGGDFVTVSGAPNQGLVRWDGNTWSPLGAGVDGTVESLLVFNDGTGPALFVGGRFTHAGGMAANHIARWKNGSWSTLGSGSDLHVPSMVVHDDGSGPALYASGQFMYGSGLTSGLGRWNGSTWLGIPGGSNGITEMASFDSGHGPRLYANSSVWDGQVWTTLPGITQPVTAMVVHDDGTGPSLFVGSRFDGQTIGSYEGLRRWDGTSFHPVGNGVGDVYIDSMIPFDEGSGPELYAAGGFDTIGGVTAHQIARWDGTTWHPLGAGMDAWTRCLALHDEGSGPTLFAGGGFFTAGGAVINRVARWKNSTWSSVGAGAGNGISSYNSAGPRTAAVHDDGVHSSLVVGGLFDFAGSTIAANIGTFDGAHWSALGEGLRATSPDNPMGGVFALASRNHDLYAGGLFAFSGSTPLANVARWDGAAWNPMGAGLPNIVYAFSFFDDGGGTALFAGGGFHSGSMWGMAKWTGTTWTAVGTALRGSVECMTVCDDGSGNALYVGGEIALSGTPSTYNVARWNGLAWTLVGPSFSGGRIRALGSFDDGSGTHLYACGNFTTSGPVTVNHVARWDGTQWQSVGGGTDDQVEALVTHDNGDGLGPELYIAGDFIVAGNTTANGVAKWDGSSWQNLGAGLGYHGWNAWASLVPFDDTQAGAPSLYLVTHMNFVGGLSSEGIGRWVGCGHPGVPYCFGDSGNCPCSATSLPGHGCPSSNDSAGALLEASGFPSLSHDSVSFIESGSPNASKLLFQGTAMVGAGSGAAFGDGLRCAGGATTRLYLHAGGSGPAVFPAGGELAVSVRGGLASPGYRTYQVWYRDPAPFCTPATFNLSNGIRILWAP